MTKQEIQASLALLSSAQKKAIAGLVDDGPISSEQFSDRRKIKAYTNLVDKGLVKMNSKGFFVTALVKKAYLASASASA